MSMNSGLTRNKAGELLRGGVVVVIGLDTGDDTPVKVDERFDVDLNRLVANEMARQDLMRTAAPSDFQDLTQFPESRGAAERELQRVGRKINFRPLVLMNGETYEEALGREMRAAARAQASGRELDAARAGSDAPLSDPPSDKPPVEPGKPGPDSGPSKA